MNNLIELGVFMFDDDVTEELREQISVAFISAIVKVSTIGANEDLRNLLRQAMLEICGCSCDEEKYSGARKGSER